MPDDRHAAFAVVRDDGVFRLEAARQIDLQLVFTLVDDGQIGMHTLADLAAGKACPARTRSCAFAQDACGECIRPCRQRRGIVPGKQNSLRKTVGQRVLQRTFERRVARQRVK